MKETRVQPVGAWDFEDTAMPFVDALYNTAYRMTRNSPLAFAHAIDALPSNADACATASNFELLASETWPA